MHIRYLTAAAAAAILLTLLQASPARAQHVVDGIFTSPSEWDTTRSTVTTQSFSPAPNGSGSSQLYAEHVYPANLWNPNGFDMLYMMADYTGSAPDANGSNTSVNFFFQDTALYCQGDYLITIGPNGVTSYEQSIYDSVKLNLDGSFYVGADSGWGSIDPRDLTGGNIEGAVGNGVSPNDPNSHLMAEIGIAIFEPYGGNFWQGIISPEPPTFFSFSMVDNGGDPVVAAGYLTLNPGGTTTISLDDPNNPGNSVIGPDGGLLLLPSGQQGQIVVPENSGAIAPLAGSGLPITLFVLRRIQRRRPAVKCAL